ncbi:MAG: SDR family NAD(P)-dependent oxidoreductase [Actinomycetota bacterium]
MKVFDYRDKVAVVTGASSGIGRAIAADLASRGTTVLAVARRKALLDEVVAEARATAPASRAAVADVADRAAVERVMRSVLKREGRVDVLVNNAGIPMRKHASRLTVEDVQRVMEINFYGSVYATVAVLPSMLERRSGHIVNVASVAGRLGSPREAAYSASKYAMAGWSDVLASDLLGSGVQVHLICPGPIATEIWGHVQEPPAYSGKFYSPNVIAKAVRRSLETGSYERWAPRRMRLASYFKTIAPKAFAKGTARYDRKRVPDPTAGQD